MKKTKSDIIINNYKLFFLTEQDNFIKINIIEDVHWTDYINYFKKFDESLYSKIYQGTLNYDRIQNSDIILSKIIYLFCSNNSCYAISSNKGMTCINKRTIYDEKNPNIKDFGSGLVEINDFDKAFHINDETIYLNPEEKEYGLKNLKHGLYHKSTFYGGGFNSKHYFDKSLLNKPILLKMAQELIEEIKDIENIETILDLSVFDIIPKPDSKKLINTPN